MISAEASNNGVMLCVFVFAACRYVALKIRAALRGEAQPEKSSAASCSLARGAFKSPGMWLCCSRLWFVVYEFPDGQIPALRDF